MKIKTILLTLLAIFATILIIGLYAERYKKDEMIAIQDSLIYVQRKKIDMLERIPIAQDYAFYKTVVNPIQYATCKVIIADVYEMYKNTFFAKTKEQQSEELTRIKSEVEKIRDSISKSIVDDDYIQLTNK